MEGSGFSFSRKSDHAKPSSLSLGDLTTAYGIYAAGSAKVLDLEIESLNP